MSRINISNSTDFTMGWQLALPRQLLILNLIEECIANTVYRPIPHHVCSCLVFWHLVAYNTVDISLVYECLH